MTNASAINPVATEFIDDFYHNYYDTIVSTKKQICTVICKLGLTWLISNYYDLNILSKSFQTIKSLHVNLYCEHLCFTSTPLLHNTHLYRGYSPQYIRYCSSVMSHSLTASDLKTR